MSYRNTCVSKYTLNIEQARVFHMVAAHNEDSRGEQLRLYVAGPAGTGKSRVLESLKDYFRGRNEEYMISVVAPTGAAAALVNGSTYHSLLGFSGRSTSNISESTAAQIRSRLQGIKYLFFDKVSMVSCTQLYNISCRL
ncbi:hypothetical protein CYLTODRAFT_363462, partial [Cylindrobasidium torrendii FP15055 ss-10]